MTDDSDVRAREREFHDALASEDRAIERRKLDAIEVALLRAAGDVRGLRVLDLGCGDGELSLALIARGALLTGLDLSEGMARLAERRAAALHPEAGATFVVAAAEAIGLPDGAFDLVIGKWVLHHTDLPAAAREVRRLLARGGRAVFAETSALNPLLRVARGRLVGRLGIPRYGTEDEHPLTQDDFALLREVFGRVSLDFPHFSFLVLFDRQVLRFRWDRVSRLLAAADRAIWRWAPPLRRYSYYVLIDAAA